MVVLSFPPPNPEENILCFGFTVSAQAFRDPGPWQHMTATEVAEDHYVASLALVGDPWMDDGVVGSATIGRIPHGKTRRRIKLDVENHSNMMYHQCRYIMGLSIDKINIPHLISIYTSVIFMSSMMFQHVRYNFQRINPYQPVISIAESLQGRKVIRLTWIRKSPFIPILAALACRIPVFVKSDLSWSVPLLKTVACPLAIENRHLPTSKDHLGIFRSIFV